MSSILFKMALIWGALAAITMPLIGTWSVWYPWPLQDDVIDHVQAAVWGTWAWLGLAPTVLLLASSWVANEIKR